MKFMNFTAVGNRLSTTELGRQKANNKPSDSYPMSNHQTDSFS